MSRTVFADSDTVMSKNVGYRQLHDRSQTDSRTQVIGEYEEGTAEYFEAAVQGNPVHCCSHTEFAYAEVDVAAVVGIRCKLSQTIQVSHC
ncbi:hypothetical protein D3C74_378640 [compost metagenome]